MSDLSDVDLNVGEISDWRSIITLIVFVGTNLVVLFPFHIPLYLPTFLVNAIADASAKLRITPPRRKPGADGYGENRRHTVRGFSRFRFPMNFITAPLIADLFLLAILAIGETEVKGGTVGSNNINPIDIMVFFLTLAYIAISIDASGLIRWLAFKVLQWGGDVGHKLFFYLYAFFFGLGSFIGNDPIILSGTAFLAYMTRVSNNIEHPRAWIHSQFAVANIASAILVSSNPTNLVLAGAFNIKFIDYTANMIVPVLITGIVLFPCLLYIIFAHERLIPLQITMHELPESMKQRTPVNPNIPNARVIPGSVENDGSEKEKEKLLSLEEIMNPFLDRSGAVFGGIVMAVTLVMVLALNAASQSLGEHPVFYVTLPAAVVMLGWDLSSGWLNRKTTRDIARRGREEAETAEAERRLRDEERKQQQETDGVSGANSNSSHIDETKSRELDTLKPARSSLTPNELDAADRQRVMVCLPDDGRGKTTEAADTDIEPARLERVFTSTSRKGEPRTLVSAARDFWRWFQETFPTVAAVLTHLPFALVPFALAMFVLVEALVTKGWIPVFAYGWDHWAEKTGVVGSIGGMAFLSVVLCNFAGTNIGTTILLSRVIQAWERIHIINSDPISDRMFWATVYAMALGVNYGAFSAAFSASLAGLLWRDILGRKHIHVRRLEFARVNLPIIAIAMSVGCAILVGEVYIYRSDTRPYSL